MTSLRQCTAITPGVQSRLTGQSFHRSPDRTSMPYLKYMHSFPNLYFFSLYPQQIWKKLVLTIPVSRKISGDHGARGASFNPQWLKRFTHTFLHLPENCSIFLLYTCLLEMQPINSYMLQTTALQFPDQTWPTVAVFMLLKHSHITFVIRSVLCFYQVSDFSQIKPFFILYSSSCCVLFALVVAWNLS